MQVLAVVNQKGGVGKTTTAVNLANGMAIVGLQTLLIDLDPQGNATTNCGIDRKRLKLNVHDCLVENVATQDTLLKISPNLNLLPANIDLVATESRLWDRQRREYALAAALQEVRDQHAFAIVDCPPSLSLLTINALVAADAFIIPTQCEYFALEGLAALQDTIDGIRSRLNASLELLGVLRTMYDPRTSLTREVSEQLATYFGPRLFKTCIPRNVRLAEAPSHGMPIQEYDKFSRGALAYRALTKEIHAMYRKKFSSWREK